MRKIPPARAEDEPSTADEAADEYIKRKKTTGHAVEERPDGLIIIRSPRKRAEYDDSGPYL